ncbi:acetolactate synthase 2 small subunit [Tatumella sp. TA1]|uniref:acetolactate synthase 2 small subunit n=1 Tax=Rosenbergiella collisarenosi TaxID=1544695 RepID=UPI0008F889F3|nr:acetolactate synthase 2 small subunit [Rosenbergiella collisarenosi]MBT0722007.1 acetolactate synthase 2 small subunit [Rosenbergiella collisarenosi]QGX92823.1 acetolactate synthase 2 small subunit [Tatumella sp. TA1]
MNQHQLTIAASHRPEVLERILRVVRHRGFEIKTMQMAQTSGPQQVNIEMTVASNRGIELLSTQLTKLIDVASVHITQHQTQQIRA